MIKVNNDKLATFDTKTTYVIADFNKTFTKGNSKTTWSIFATSDLFDENYTKERNELFTIYKPFEDDQELDEKTKKLKLSEWWEKHINLFPKYKLNKNLIEKALLEDKIMELRNGVKSFLTFLNNNDIPLIIISQGIGNFAEVFLKMNNCYFENTRIISNMITFDNNIANGYAGSIIHSFNKDEAKLPEDILETINKRNQVLLLGDEISDLKMLDIASNRENIKVAFLTEKHQNEINLYNEKFDVVCSDDTSYDEIGRLIFNNYDY